MTGLTLEAVKQDFNTWRASRSKSGRIPNELWDKALSLLNNYQISEITKTLRLSGGQMKAKRERLAGFKKPKKLSKFVEVSLPTILQPTINNRALTCKIGLSRTDGTTLMIEHVPESTLMQILNNFIAGRF